jgi:hypothetical protein
MRTQYYYYHQIKQRCHNLTCTRERVTELTLVISFFFFFFFPFSSTPMSPIGMIGDDSNNGITSLLLPNINSNNNNSLITQFILANNNKNIIKTCYSNLLVNVTHQRAGVSHLCRLQTGLCTFDDESIRSAPTEEQISINYVIKRIKNTHLNCSALFDPLAQLILDCIHNQDSPAAAAVATMNHHDDETTITIPEPNVRDFTLNYRIKVEMYHKSPSSSSSSQLSNVLLSLNVHQHHHQTNNVLNNLSPTILQFRQVLLSVPSPNTNGGGSFWLNKNILFFFTSWEMMHHDDDDDSNHNSVLPIMTMQKFKTMLLILIELGVSQITCITNNLISSTNNTTTTTTLLSSWINAQAGRIHLLSPMELNHFYTTSSSNHPHTNNNNFQFDAAISIGWLSSIGLGVLGEGENPFGDLFHVARLCCLVKSDGIFILGGKTSNKMDRLIYKHERIYGPLRWPMVLRNTLPILYNEPYDDGEIAYFVAKNNHGMYI